MPTPEPAPQPLTRRTALAGLLGLGGTLGLSGCGLDGLRVQVPGSGSATPSGAASPAVGEDARSGDTGSDERLVTRLVGELTPVLALLGRTTARHPALRSRLAPLEEVLRTDLATLRDAGRASATATPSTTPPRAVPGDRDAALGAVVRSVAALRDSLGRSALSALSGRFARLIASMAAALAQRLRPLAPAPLATRVPELPSASPSGDDGADSPLQDALAGEHAAVYVFAVLGAQTSASSQPDLYERLLAAYTWHRGCRDRLVATLTARDQAPVAAAPSYSLPNAVASPAQVGAAARVTEQRVAGAYGRLVQETVGGDRAWAVALLREAALRELVLGGSPGTFPGTTG